uniref:DUF6816 domain-containing protein n=1 Tax=Pyrodinium bahamense TaxID=73915 RepID=A0A7S0B2Z5_9DINO
MAGAPWAPLGVGGASLQPGAASAEEQPPPPTRTPLQQRLGINNTDLEKLPTGYISPWGPDDLYYPSWLEGRWRVQQTLQAYSAPLGKKYLAGGNLDVANKVLSDEQRQLGRPVEFELRYVRTQRNNTVEDRAFNVAARLNAFAGRKVVKSTEYVDVPSNTRELALQAGNGPEDPLLTTLVTFKGAVQKIFITSFETETGDGGDVWRGLASTRTLLAAPGSGANPVVADEEVVTALRRGPDGDVRGRLRLIGFLNPKDALYFEAGNHAVTIADYSLQYTPIRESEAAVAEPVDTSSDPVSPGMAVRQ